MPQRISGTTKALEKQLQDREQWRREEGGKEEGRKEGRRKEGRKHNTTLNTHCLSASIRKRAPAKFPEKLKLNKISVLPLDDHSHFHILKNEDDFIMKFGQT